MNQTRRLAFASLASFALLASSAAGAGPLDWLFGPSLTGSGVIARQTRTPGHFTGVDLGLSEHTEVRFGDTESVTVEADDNILPKIETVVEGGVLKVRLADGVRSISRATIRVTVQARELDRVSIGGSGNVDVQPLRAANMEANVSGSGSVRFRSVDADALVLAISGSGNVRVDGGSVRTLKASISGSGDVQADHLQALAARVSIAGSGRTALAVRDTLDGSISGSGHVSYRGDPKTHVTVSGSGGVRRVGPDGAVAVAGGR